MLKKTNLHKEVQSKDINKQNNANNNKSKVPQWKRRLFEIIQIDSSRDAISRAFDIFISLMIVLSIVVTYLNTFEEMEKYSYILGPLEAFTIIVFIIEYILRIYTSDLLYQNSDKMHAVFSFVFSWYGIVDLLTIISYYAPLYSNGIVVFRLIRVFRILKLFRINKSFDAFRIVAEVIEDKKSQLLSSISMILILMLAASLCIYGFEHEAQPEVFKNGFSGIWWAMSTVLTVGYGDIFPITVGGRIVAIVIALLGVCVVAIPTGILSAGFVEYYSRIKSDNRQIKLDPDVAMKLKYLAKKEGVSKENYVEHLIMDKFL